MAKSPSSNVVLLILGSEVVARFEPTPTEKEDGSVVVSQAMTQARRVLEAAATDSEHELHEAVMSGNLEIVNTKVSTVRLQTQSALSFG